MILVSMKFQIHLVVYDIIEPVIVLITFVGAQARSRVFKITMWDTIR